MPRNEPLEETYFKWLTRPLRPAAGRPYWRLFAYLHSTEFTYFIPNDDDRAAWGQELRQTFHEDTGRNIPPSWQHGVECSVLEMMIALAGQMEYNTGSVNMSRMNIAGPSGELPIADRFWEMIRNLGLDQFSDAKWDERKVSRIIQRLLWRQYTPRGVGGLFPLPPEVHGWNPLGRKDQRRIGLWEQMNAYKIEQSSWEETA